MNNKVDTITSIEQILSWKPCSRYVTDDGNPTPLLKELASPHASLHIFEIRNLPISADDQNWLFRVAIARLLLSSETQAVLCVDSNWSVRSGLASNQNINAETQAVLSVDSDPYVRRNLASNQNINGLTR